jgi:phosphoglycolate phosphatase-like HAD superfamily hydrolase
MPDVLSPARRLWLFDLDGTLVSPSEDQLNAWVAAFRDVFGFEAAPAAITPHLGLTFAGVVRAVAGALGQPAPSSRIPEALAVYSRHVREGLARRPARLLPGVRELLRFLREERGDVVGVVTGNFAGEGEPKLAAVGLRPLLDVVVFSDFGTSGRDSLIRRALHAARRLGFPGGLSDTMVVGDSVHDVESGRRLGTVSIAVCTGLTPPDRLRGAKPDLVFPDLAALLTSLRHAGAAWAPSG